MLIRTYSSVSEGRMTSIESSNTEYKGFVFLYFFLSSSCRIAVCYFIKHKACRKLHTDLCCPIKVVFKSFQPEFLVCLDLSLFIDWAYKTCQTQECPLKNRHYSYSLSFFPLPLVLTDSWSPWTRWDFTCATVSTQHKHLLYTVLRHSVSCFRTSSGEKWIDMELMLNYS